MEAWVLGQRSGHWRAVLGPQWSSGSGIGLLDHGMVIWPTVDVCILIKDLILGSRTGFLDGLLGPRIKVWNLDVSLNPWSRYESWEKGLGTRENSAPLLRSGTGAGPLGQGMVVWTTVDVWIPIKDWIVGLRSGPWDGFLGIEVKVWEPYLGLNPGWRYGFWERGLGIGGWSGPQVEVWVKSWTSGLWNGGLDYCGGLDPVKVLHTGFEVWAWG